MYDSTSLTIRFPLLRMINNLFSGNKDNKRQNIKMTQVPINSYQLLENVSIACGKRTTVTASIKPYNI